MAVFRENLDEQGNLRIHSLEGAVVDWTFLTEDGLADPTPPTVLRLRVEGTPGLSKLLTVGASPHIYQMSITLAEAQALRAASYPNSIRWALVDETPTVPVVVWEGLIVWEGW